MRKKDLNLIRSGIIGVCVGDALGSPVQFKMRKYLKNNPITEMIGLSSWKMSKGTWSDDSSLTLCLAESLSRGYNIKDIANNFLKWFRKGFLTPDDIAFDIGRTTSASMHRIEEGFIPEEAGGKNIDDNGNGSLMRILPLSFYLESKVTDNNLYYEIIKNVSSITHAHMYSIIACFIYIDIATQMIKGESFKESYLQILSNKNYYFNLLDADGKEKFNRILNGNIETCNEEDISSTGFVIDSLEASLWCLLNSKSYRETLLKAVNLGGDTDTIAAIAGGLAGINYGIENIPKSWMNDLRKVELIEEVCKNFSYYCYAS